MKTLNISPMIFHSQPQAEHMLGKRRTVMQNNFTFHEFFFKCATLHISQINSFLDLNQNKRLLDNKTGGPLDTTDTFWDTFCL